MLKASDGILVRWFGIRGIEGKIIQRNMHVKIKVPYLGLCLGLQIMTIEYAQLSLE